MSHHVSLWDNGQLRSAQIDIELNGIPLELPRSLSRTFASSPYTKETTTFFCETNVIIFKVSSGHHANDNMASGDATYLIDLEAHRITSASPLDIARLFGP
ncbi:hypothetical protein ACFFUB_06470 [Algimonas porphyrae]|nr:hypothetical protein [Algimonas porphyrae]